MCIKLYVYLPNERSHFQQLFFSISTIFSAIVFLETSPAIQTRVFKIKMNKILFKDQVIGIG